LHLLSNRKFFKKCQASGGKILAVYSNVKETNFQLIGTGITIN